MSGEQLQTHAETVERLGRNTANYTAGRIDLAEWDRRTGLILEDRFPGTLAADAQRRREMLARKLERARAS